MPSLTLSRFGGALIAAGYSAEDLARLVGERSIPTLFGQSQLEVYRRRIHSADDGQLATLARIFLLGELVSLQSLERALPGIDPDGLERAGILSSSRNDRSAIGSRFRITPWRDLLFAHDPYASVDARPEHVTGITAATKTLASLTVRLESGSSLDIGAGCGAQALLLARHSREVVATDVNQHALFLTELNSSLNDLPNVTARLGSLFEPVANETFDLIVCNPPYVISPETALIFRDSGRSGDSICRDVLENVGSYLKDRGFATIMCNWAVPQGEKWWEPLQEWLRPSDCNAWILHYRTEEPLAYARKWNSPLESQNPGAFAEALERWGAYYDSHGITAIASGAVVLQRQASGSTWRRWATMPDGVSDDATAHLERTFSNIDYLERLATDDELLRSVFSFAGAHSLDQRIVFEEGQHRVAGTALRMIEGVGISLQLEAAMVHLLFRLDGKTPLRQILTDVAASLGIEAGDMEAKGIQTIRALLEGGFLEPEARAG